MKAEFERDRLKSERLKLEVTGQAIITTCSSSVMIELYKHDQGLILWKEDIEAIADIIDELE